MLQKIILFPVYIYQHYISPYLPARCRYYPTCSHYMVDAIHVHGVFKGVIMGISRILRCHPFVPGGIDYVPLHFSIFRNRDETYYGPYTKEHIRDVLKEKENEQKK